jgi:hypothetical protein
MQDRDVLIEAEQLSGRLASAPIYRGQGVLSAPGSPASAASEENRKQGVLPVSGGFDRRYG